MDAGDPSRRAAWEQYPISLECGMDRVDYRPRTHRTVRRAMVRASPSRPIDSPTAEFI